MIEVNNDAVEISDLACVKDSIELYVEAGEDTGEQWRAEGVGRCWTVGLYPISVEDR